MKKVKVIEVQRMTRFNGDRKIGLDTNVLIKLYDNPYFFEYEESRIFNLRETIFIHAQCQWEFINYIKKHKRISEQEARTEAKNFVRVHNINIIYPKECIIKKEEITSFEDYANKRFKELNKTNLKCHFPDSFILLSYQKSGINKIISTDLSFRESAQLLNIDGASLPSLNYNISREFKKIFNYKYKNEKRRH